MFEYPGLKFEVAVVPLKVASNDTEIAALIEPCTVFNEIFGLTFTASPLAKVGTLPN